MVREIVNLVSNSKWGVTLKPGMAELFNVHAQRRFVALCCMSACGHTFVAVGEMTICGD